MKNKTKAFKVLKGYSFTNSIPHVEQSDGTLEIKEGHYYPASGTFGAIDKARAFARKKGYTIGTMCCDEPIGLAKDVPYISKWRNLGADAARLDGVIIPDPEFREGGAAIIIFNKD